jgi:hypothetical protein
MARRSRILAFGGAATLALAGTVCAILVPGLLGQVLTTVLLSLGLSGAVLLVFLEIGLSEDRALEQESARREAESARLQEAAAREPRDAARPATGHGTRPSRPARLIRGPRRPG